jgi:hypothetical protein
MSQPKPKPEPLFRCWDCGAENDRGASECWLCQRGDWRAPPRAPLPVKSGPSPSSDNATPLVVLVLGLLALGGFAIAPGLAIALLVLLALAWIGAEMIEHRRQNRDLPTSTARKVVWIAVLAVTIPVVLGVTLFTALWLICLVNGPPSFH